MFQSKTELAINAFLRNGPKGILNLYNRKHDEKTLPIECNFMPTALQIEPTTRCNLKCTMCEHTFLKDKGLNVGIELFKKTVEGNPFLELVNLTGIGESLMNPDFFKMIEYAKSKSLYVWFNDNFILMNESNAQKLIELKTDAIAISIDGATKKVYESIRVGGKFEKLLENIKNFQELKKKLKASKPKLFFVMVVMKENFFEMAKLVEVASSLGINDIFYVGVLPFNETQELGLFKAKKSAVEQAIVEAKEASKKFGVKLHTLPELEVQKIDVCIYPWTSPYISAAGEVFPCCFVTQRNNPELMHETILGNVNEQKLSEIWNGPKYKKFREKWLAKDLPNICKNCPKITGIY